jgi:transposase-like protein
MAKDIKCAFGVEVEAVAGWLGSYGGDDSPSDIQRGMHGGARVGVTTEDKARIQELERANRELGRANEILKTGVGLFARELDPRLPRL